MPIHSEEEAELEERLASLLAGAGASSSLAATAAAMLRANPSKELTPRMLSAVRSVIEVVERALTIGAAFPAGEEAASRFAFPEQIVMSLVEQPRPRETSEPRQEAMISILNDLQSLLREPTVEVAERAEQFLAELSRLETLHAQLLVRGEREDALLARAG